jgi:hypothetical protein
MMLNHYAEAALAPCLDVDPARVGLGEVTHQLFRRRWILKGIALENLQQLLCLRLQACRFKLLRILERLLRETSVRLTS